MVDHVSSEGIISSSNNSKPSGTGVLKKEYPIRKKKIANIENMTAKTSYRSGFGLFTLSENSGFSDIANTKPALTTVMMDINKGKDAAIHLLLLGLVPNLDRVDFGLNRTDLPPQYVPVIMLD